MIIGLTLGQFTALHVAISLVAIASGIVVMAAFAAGHRRIAVLSALFLLTTAATTITGFMFPFNGPTPAFLTGVVSVPMLALAFAAYFGLKLRSRAAAVYAVSASIALYLNLLAFVTQAFLKIPPLHALAPSGTEPPFLVAQVVMLVAMIIVGALSFRAARRV